VAVAPAKAVEVMIRGWIAAVTVKGIVAFAVRVGEPASETLMVMLKLPVAVGVPEMRPLLPRLSPVGRPLADQV
jgi:hypothetical protein